jgi:hypothetical protein
MRLENAERAMRPGCGVGYPDLPYEARRTPDLSKSQDDHPPISHPLR